MYRLFIFLIKFKTFIEHDRYYNGDIIDQEIHKWQKLNNFRNAGVEEDFR